MLLQAKDNNGKAPSSPHFTPQTSTLPLARWLEMHLWIVQEFFLTLSCYSDYCNITENFHFFSPRNTDSHYKI